MNILLFLKSSEQLSLAVLLQRSSAEVFRTTRSKCKPVFPNLCTKSVQRVLKFLPRDLVCHQQQQQQQKSMFSKKSLTLICRKF